MPAYAAVLEVQSTLLAEALQQAKLDQHPSEEGLLLHIPQASTAQLYSLLRLAYEPTSTRYASLNQLKALSELAALLQCKDVLRRLETSIISSCAAGRLHATLTITPSSTSTSGPITMGLPRLEEYTARFMPDHLQTGKAGVLAGPASTTSAAAHTSPTATPWAR